jgi:probable HAF family extracellular repeat protein
MSIIYTQHWDTNPLDGLNRTTSTATVLRSRLLDSGGAVQKLAQTHPEDAKRWNIELLKSAYIKQQNLFTPDHVYYEGGSTPVEYFTIEERAAEAASKDIITKYAHEIRPIIAGKPSLRLPVIRVKAEPIDDVYVLRFPYIRACVDMGDFPVREEVLALWAQDKKLVTNVNVPESYEGVCRMDELLRIVEHDFIFIALDVPPGLFGTRVLGINDRNQIVGGDGEGKGFLYANEGIETLPMRGASYVQAYGINDSGWFVGMYVDGGTQVSHGFLSDEITFITIAPPGATSTTAYGINDEGHVVGFYQDRRGGHGFRYINGMFTDLDFPGASATHATGINRKGQVVGFYFDPKDRRSHGFIYDSGTFTKVDYPSPDGFHTRLQGISDSGDIVGFCLCGPIQAARGFLYRDGIFTDIAFPHASETFPNGINQEGRIVGFYNGADAHGFFAVPRQKP